MNHITSTDNILIKTVAKLKTKKGRQLQQQFLAEGIRTCSTIINGGFKPIYIFVTEPILDKKIPFIKNKIVYCVSEKVLKKVSPVATPSGLVCVFSIRPEPSFLFLQEGIVLANIQDPGNMGTLIRTCSAFGKKTVICINSVDPWNSKVIQASAGTIANVYIFRLSWDELLEHKRNHKLVALVVSEGKHPQNINFNKALLVIGNEAYGIPKPWLSTCNEYMTIPMPGSTESLNAAVSGGIAMYLAWSLKK